MSKVDEYSKPDWTKVSEGTVFWDSRCCSCSCCNQHSGIIDLLGSSWGTFTRDDVEYAVYQTKEFLPTPLIIGLLPCFFLHWAMLSCMPITEAIVVGFNRKTNETFAEVREKSMCGGWVKQARKRIREVTCTIEPGIFMSSGNITVFSDDNQPALKIPVKVTQRDSIAGCKEDIEGFVRTVNELIERSRSGAGAGGFAPPYGMDRSGDEILPAEVYIPNVIQMATAVAIEEPSAPPGYSDIDKR